MNEYLRLDECCQIEISSIDKKAKSNEEPVKLCNFTDVYRNWNIYSSMIDSFMDATASKKNIDTFSLNHGDVVITKDSETRDDIGMSALIYDDLPNTVLGYHCALIRPKRLITGSFLNAYLNSYLGRKYFENQASGSGQRYTLTKEALGSILIPMLPMEQQTVIGNFFSDIDKKIKTNNEIISELESLAKTIYDYWFLQFEFPNEDGKPYKSSGGKMVWNEEMKREIPEGWEAKKLDDIVILLKDGTHNPPKRINHGIPLLTGTMFGKNFLDYSGVTYISNDDFQKIHSKYAPESGDIVMTKIGTIGNVNMLCENDIPIAIHCNSALLRFPREIQGMFPLQMLKSQEFQARIHNNKGQSIQEFLSLSKLGSIPVIVPQEQTIKNFNTLTSPFLEKMGSIREENKTLQSLRDFLLPMLMNGQVTFKEEA